MNTELSPLLANEADSAWDFADEDFDWLENEWSEVEEDGRLD